MAERISEERRALLSEYGFGEPPICDLLTVFSCPTLALETRMSVRGAAEDELAYIYYASVEVKGERLEGLFYLPSLLEELYLLKRGEDPSFDMQLAELNGTLGTDMRLVFLSGSPAIFSEIYPSAWTMRDLRYEISDMLKLVGATEYILNRELEIIRTDGAE